MTKACAKLAGTAASVNAAMYGDLAAVTHTRGSYNEHIYTHCLVEQPS